jgi:sugar phosphate isomerase/epimerase
LTLSLNLPCSSADGGVCSLKEEGRKSTVELQKLCVQFAADIGAKYVNLYPGSVPSERTTTNYKELARAPLLKSLMELGKFASELGLALNMENNSGSDEIYSEIGDCLSIVKEVREHDVPVYFNFDIGNWLKRADFGTKIPPQPESSLESIPPEYIKELHLNDYVPCERISRPPIHLEWGLLKHVNLERFARLAKEKKVETVVLETEMKSIEQALNFKKILRDESDYVLDLFK